MANNDLGNVSVKLTADGTELNSNLQAAQSKIGGWTDSVNAKAGGGGGLMAALGLGPVGLAAGAAFGLIVGGIALAHSATMGLKDSLNGIYEEGKRATEINIGYQDLQTVMMQTKQSAGETAEMFSQMGRTISLAAMGSSKAMRSLQILGFSQEEARGLASMNAADRYEAIAGRLETRQHGALRSFAAGNLGFDANALRAIDTRHENQAFSEGAGFRISDEQLAAAEVVGNAWKKTGMLIDAMWRQVTVAVAPYLEIVSTGMLGIWTTLQPIITNGINIISGYYTVIGALVKEFVALFDFEQVGGFFERFKISAADAKTFFMDAAEMIASSVAYLIDLFMKFGGDFTEYAVVPSLRGWALIIRAGADFLESITDTVVPTFIRGMRMLLESLRAVANLIPGMSGRLDTAIANLDRIPNMVEGVFDAVHDGADRLEGVADALVPAADIIRNLDGTEEAVHGFFDRARARMNTPLVPRVREEQVIDTALLQRGSALSERFQDPMEKLRIGLGGINEMLEKQNALWEAGIGEAEDFYGYIDEQTAARAMLEELSQAESALKIGPEKHAQMMLAGSSAAANLILHANDNRQDPAERLRIIQERSLAVQTIQAEQGRLMVEALRERPNVIRL